MKGIDKFRKIAVVAFVLAGVFAYASEQNRVKTLPKYKGEGDGLYDILTVEITVDKNRKGEPRITDIVVEHVDTPEIAGPAVESLKKQILAKQTTNMEEIEGVAGATFTSDGVKMALEAALAQIDAPAEETKKD